MNNQIYGGGKVSAAIADELSKLDNKNLSNRTAGFLNQYFRMVKVVKGMECPRQRRYLMELVRKDFLERAVIHPNIDSFVRNIICARAKQVVKKAAIDSLRHRQELR